MEYISETMFAVEKPKNLLQMYSNV